LALAGLTFTRNLYLRASFSRVSVPLASCPPRARMPRARWALRLLALTPQFKGSTPPQVGFVIVTHLGVQGTESVNLQKKFQTKTVDSERERFTDCHEPGGRRKLALGGMTSGLGNVVTV